MGVSHGHHHSDPIVSVVAGERLMDWHSLVWFFGFIAVVMWAIWVGTP